MPREVDGLSSELSDLCQAWLKQQRYVDEQESRLRQERTDLKNAHDRFAAKLAPKDLKVGETVAIWVRIGDSKHEELIQVSRVPSGMVDAETGADSGATKLALSIRGRERR